jgi:hypothetical protein
MGLDITYFQFAEPTGSAKEGESDFLHTAHDAGFPRSFAGLVDGQCYALSGTAGRFRAGPYATHFDFRFGLWQAANGCKIWELWKHINGHADAPFALLCAFPDHQGDIGPIAAKKLALDFNAYRSRVRPQLIAMASECFGELYDDWQKCFETAADTGIVIFH